MSESFIQKEFIMKKSKQVGVIALFLALFTLSACGPKGPSEEEIGALVLDYVIKENSIKLDIEKVKIITTSSVSENAEELSVEFVLEAKEKLFKRVSVVQLGGDGAPYCELLKVELDKGNTVGGKAVVFARYADEKWSYRIMSVTTDLTLSGDNYRSNITNLVSSPSEIEKAQDTVSFVLTPKSKAALLGFIGEKQLSEKQKVEAELVVISALKEEVNVLGQQYSFLEKEFRSAENIESEKNETALKTFKKESRATLSQSKNACRAEQDKQYNTDKQSYLTQYNKLGDAYQVEYDAIGDAKKQAVNLKYAKEITPAEYEAKLRVLDERLSKNNNENERLKALNEKEKKNKDNIRRNASLACYAEAKSKADYGHYKTYQETLVQKSDAILSPLIKNLNQIQEEINTSSKSISLKQSRVPRQRYLDSIKSLVENVEFNNS